MEDKDVTDVVMWGDNDSEALPILLCACGAEFVPWEHIISVYRDGAYPCPKCGRKLYFTMSIKVFEVVE